MIDVAIVGGGVAGTYCAYRLAQERPGETVSLYEMSDRIGGRLWSVPIDVAMGSPVEIGGMYFTDIQHNVVKLVDRLGLSKAAVTFERKHHFLRGRYLTDETFRSSPPRVPFDLRADETGKSPPELLAEALERIAPGATDLWPVNTAPPRSPRATLRRLRMMRHEGRPLHEWGFWNLLADKLSNEAYALLTSTFGTIGLFRNSNAFDAIWNLLHEFGAGGAWKLTDGYQRLPTALLKAAGVTARLGCRLRAVRRTDDGFRLLFKKSDGRWETVLAKSVILAMPQFALQRIGFDRSLFADYEQFRRLRDDSLLPMRSCKLFLVFDAPWWDRSKVGPSALSKGKVGAAYTDLPMQQCYYFGEPGAKGPSVLMAAYADDAGAGFWAALVSPSYCDFPSPTGAGAGHLCSSDAMAASALKQLKSMHADLTPPTPRGALFWDWGRDPFGAAWHAWAPHVESSTVRPLMRQPNPELPMFICGEAYSQRNGWVEGAINSAEMALRRYGLDRAPWVDADFEFEFDGGEEMAENRLAELLGALAESLPLQRAYARDREAIIKAFGLSRKEAAALTDNDEAAIRKLLGADMEVCFILGIKKSDAES